jgi:hypothetical protein
MGCFAECGWAWNVKPSLSEVGWKASVPSAEFTESFVIFLYGCTNVFLEHLGGWGGAWSAGDLEHVSISVMFFGGGLVRQPYLSQTLFSLTKAVWHACRVHKDSRLAEHDCRDPPCS